MDKNSANKNLINLKFDLMDNILNFSNQSDKKVILKLLNRKLYRSFLHSFCSNQVFCKHFNENSISLKNLIECKECNKNVCLDCIKKCLNDCISTTYCIECTKKNIFKNSNCLGCSEYLCEKCKIYECNCCQGFYCNGCSDILFKCKKCRGTYCSNSCCRCCHSCSNKYNDSSSEEEKMEKKKRLTKKQKPITTKKTSLIKTKRTFIQKKKND